MNKPKVNWDGEYIPPGPWIDWELFSIGGFKVTIKHLVISIGGIIGIILSVVIIFCSVSWWKRKNIAEAGRRMSNIA